jgi:septal ring factor EnvC (AmiA/AmiB activator)
MEGIDDDAECTGFELGLSTREEILTQQCRLLESEIQEVFADLRAARKRTGKLVSMYAEVSSQVAKLQSELTVTKRELSCTHGELSHAKNRLNAPNRPIQ